MCLNMSLKLKNFLLICVLGLEFFGDVNNNKYDQEKLNSAFLMP